MSANTTTKTKTSLNIKIDKNVKERAAKLLESMGLDHTTAIEMYYRQIIAEQGLPFTPSVKKHKFTQLLDLMKEKGVPAITLEMDIEGNVMIDKDKHPDLHDWSAMNDEDF